MERGEETNMRNEGGFVKLIHRFPPTTGSKTFNQWTSRFVKGHILYSKCPKNGECETEMGTKCIFCSFNEKLELKHLPDMVFAQNSLSMEHASGFTIKFCALDALLRVSSGKLPVKVACSDSWRESREEAKGLQEVAPFDWTFTTDYRGTLSGDFEIHETEERINIEKLKQKEKILFYEDMLLFEDELHDNGVASCSVKMRVMPSCYFILLRYFLRVDNVMLKVNDTRYYHEFDTNYVIREYTSQEAKVEDLGVPAAMLHDANEIAQMLPVNYKQYEKLTYPPVQQES